MRWWKCILVGSATLILSTANSSAEGFTASDVLAWEQGSQDWYFEVSVGMAGVVATQNSEKIAACIDDWYFKSDATKGEANSFIRTTMRRFPDYNPGGVLAAVIEKQCGSLTFK